jgi:hypothetical protein
MDTGTQKAEIDLLDIAVGSVRSVIKNLTWVILITISGGIGGYLTSKFSSVYESQMMIKARRLKDKELAFLLLNYQKRGIPGLTKQEQRDHLQDFSFIVHTDNFQLDEKEKSLESFATVTVKLNDSTLFQKIQAGIIGRMNNEKIVKNYYTLDNQINQSLITQYKDKIRRAEALIERKPNEEAVVLFPEMMNMQSKLTELETVYQQPIVAAVNDFEPLNTRINPITSIIVGLLAGMVFSAIFIGIRSFASYYKKVTAGT